MKISEMSGLTIGEGKYKLKKLLGSGGFGTVFSADEMLGNSVIREIAIKLYSPEITEFGIAHGMFEDCSFPAKILSSDEPSQVKRHFVQVYNFGTLHTPIGECAYLTMELVRNGRTLEKEIEFNREIGILPKEKEIVDLMTQFFTALSVAHRNGVIHRDIKGANTMLCNDNGNSIIRIMDFGCGAFTSYTGAQLKTTISIMAPECFVGEDHTIVSDIYQAGLMFYAYYTGMEPFVDETGNTDMQVQHRMRLGFDPKKYNGANSSMLIDSILAKCLCFNPQLRYQTADEVLKALGKTGIQAAEDAIYANMPELALEITDKIIANNDILVRDELLRFQKIRAKALCMLKRYEDALEWSKLALETAEVLSLQISDFDQWDAIIDEIAVCYLRLNRPSMAKLIQKRKVHKL